MVEVKRNLDLALDASEALTGLIFGKDEADRIKDDKRRKVEEIGNLLKELALNI